MTVAVSEAGPRQPRIPVTLVTGFLGSGKTTLINKALRSPEMAGAIVIVNEFGEVQLDHQLVAGSDDAVVVLENGCLCCTVRSDLIGTLNALYHDREARRIPFFDRVIIETSGLAEPGPVLQAFLSEPTLDGLFTVVNVITLVDAVNWPDTVKAHEEAVRQVALADAVLLTKLDLVEDRAECERKLRKTIARINPSAEIVAFSPSSDSVTGLLDRVGFDAADPKADPRDWLKLEAYEHHGDEAGHADHPHGHEHHDHLREKGIESFVLLRDDPLSRDELRLLLDGLSQNLGPGLLRVKGLVNIQEEPGRPAVIQGAQHLLHTMTWLEKWPDDDQRSRIVFITQGVPRENLKEIVEMMSRVTDRTFKARKRARAAGMSGD
jgi:G3E family GTPase